MCNLICKVIAEQNRPTTHWLRFPLSLLCAVGVSCFSEDMKVSHIGVLASSETPQRSSSMSILRPIEVVPSRVTAYANIDTPIEGGKYAAIDTPNFRVPLEHGVVAADIRYWPYGTIVHIPEYGLAVVADRGRWVRGRGRFDVVHIVDDPVQAEPVMKQWGDRRAVPVSILYVPQDRTAAMQLLRHMGVRTYLEYHHTALKAGRL